MRYRACGAETRSVALPSGALLNRRNGDFFYYHPYTEDLLQVLGLIQDLRTKQLELNKILLGNIIQTRERSKESSKL